MRVAPAPDAYQAAARNHHWLVVKWYDLVGWPCTLKFCWAKAALVGATGLPVCRDDYDLDLMVAQLRDLRIALEEEVRRRS